MIKKLILILFFGSTLLGKAQAAIQLSNLSNTEVIIQTDKSNYLLGEQVNFKIELINKTAENVFLPSMSDSKSIDYMSVLYNGKYLKFHGTIVDYFKEPVLILNPFEKRIIYLNLTDNYGLFIFSKATPVEKIVVNRFFNPGKYEVSFNYKNKLFGSTTFKVDSLTIEQDIKYKELLDIYSISYHNIVNYEKKVDKIREFIEKYPGTDYLDQNACFNVFFYSHYKKDFSQNERDEVLSIIDKIPNSYSSINYVYFLSEIISHNPTEENINLFDDLLKRYPDTILSYEIKKLRGK